MNKKEKKGIISKCLDLTNGRFKDEEVDTMFDIVSNPERYDGMTRTKRNVFTDWSSDGKYTREEETTFTIHADGDEVCIDEEYNYHDDDGQEGGYSRLHDNGRDFINTFKSIFGKD